MLTQWEVTFFNHPVHNGPHKTISARGIRPARETIRKAFDVSRRMHIKEEGPDRLLVFSCDDRTREMTPIGSVDRIRPRDQLS